MNEEEIKQAIEVLKQPITVNCVDYHYFTQEQYDNLFRVYDNALWLSNTYEQVLEEHHQLISTLVEIREYIKAETKREGFHHYLSDDELDDLLQIIDKGVNNE